MSIFLIHKKITGGWLARVSEADCRRSVEDPNQLATVETAEDPNQLAMVETSMKMSHNYNMFIEL
jgi:hypothetical protein